MTALEVPAGLACELRGVRRETHRIPEVGPGLSCAQVGMNPSARAIFDNVMLPRVAALAVRRAAPCGRGL